LEEPTALERVEEGVVRDEEDGKGDFWNALIASAKRRKSITGPSPLAAVVEGEDVSVQCVELGEDTDGDTFMMTGEVEVSSPTESLSLSSPATSSTVGSVAMDMLKDLMKRKTSRRERTCSTRESTYSVPLLTVSKTVVTKVDEDVGLGDLEAMLGEEFPVLEKVESRTCESEVDVV
jgi:hypothetical protein